MAGPLTNARHERYCSEVAQGKSQDEAYALAGFAPSRFNASRLAAREDVRARILELQSAAAAETVVTIADIARQLDEDRAFAKKCETPAAMVSATMGKAKLFGFLRDKLEHSGPNGVPIDINVKVSWVDPPVGE